MKAVVLNDATAACLAEIDARRDGEIARWFTFYVGTVVGGDVMLHKANIVAGRTGNAGAVGAIPLALATENRKSKPAQLIEALRSIASKTLRLGASYR